MGSNQSQLFISIETGVSVAKSKTEKNIPKKKDEKESKAAAITNQIQTPLRLLKKNISSNPKYRTVYNLLYILYKKKKGSRINNIFEWGIYIYI